MKQHLLNNLPPAATHGLLLDESLILHDHSSPSNTNHLLSPLEIFGETSVRSPDTNNPTVSENLLFDHFEEQNSNLSDIFNLFPSKDSSSASGTIDLTLNNDSANGSNAPPSQGFISERNNILSNAQCSTDFANVVWKKNQKVIK